LWHGLDLFFCRHNNERQDTENLLDELFFSRTARNAWKKEGVGHMTSSVETSEDTKITHVSQKAVTATKHDEARLGSAAKVHNVPCWHISFDKNA
jgi:hypothetical protein